MTKKQSLKNAPLEETTDNAGGDGGIWGGTPDIAAELNLNATPDDVSPPGDQTMGDKAKQFFSNFFTSGGSEGAESTQKKRGGTTHKKKFKFSNHTVMIAGLLVGWVSASFDDEYKDCAPSVDEINNMLAPLARIADRHMPPLGEVNPDVTDTWLSLWALGLYIVHARATYVMIKKLKEQENATKEQVNPFIRHFSTDSYATSTFNDTPFSHE